MAAPKRFLDLVDKFTRNAEDYRSPGYNEAQARQEFINPFFKCLGWDMDNEQGYAEAYKDVIHEDAIKVGGATKAPDYCFRIGGGAVPCSEIRNWRLSFGTIRARHSSSTGICGHVVRDLMIRRRSSCDT